MQPSNLSANIKVSRHPLVAHKLSVLRDRSLTTKQFRELSYELGILLGTDATADLELVEGRPLLLDNGTSIPTVRVKQRVAIIPILRAGLGLVEAMLHHLPNSTVRHLGIFREKSTMQPVEYYNRLPSECDVDEAIVLDLMIATAGTANAAIDVLKDWGVRRIKFVSILVSAKGIASLAKKHPDVDFFVAGIDQGLSPSGQIVPGIGDAGNRLFNTE